MARRDLYKTRGTEPNMREELLHTLEGFFPEIPKAQTGVLRKMRRDSNGDLTYCDCVDPNTHEPDKDTFCPYCWGESYYWDEEFIEFYKVVIRSDVGLSTKEEVLGPGLLNIELISFYLPYDILVTEEDKIIEIKLDVKGDVIRPYKRKKLYRIGTPIDFRSDNGKLEYWKLDCYAEHRKFLNGVR